MITRRDFLKYSAITGAAVTLPLKFGVRSAEAAASSPLLQKWIQPLRGLTALGDAAGVPCAVGMADPVFANTSLYQIACGEFTDTLHPALGPTTLWGYWDNNPASPAYNLKRHIGGLIINTRGTASRLRFTNVLPNLHPLPIDTTIPGAGIGVQHNRIATHLHGGYVPWISDGGPFDWWTSTGASGTSFQNGPGSILDNIPTNPMAAGQADYFYPNDQSTRLMWYHDHAFGITRLNAYAGIATGYVVIDPAQETALGTMVPPITSLIPLVFQDKVFVNPATIALTDPTWAIVAPAKSQTLGSLWYEHVYDPRAFKLATGNAFLAPPDPSAIPEFFGDTMLCNGTVYPLVTVEAKRYRFMMLNACNARFLNINLLQVAPGAEIATNPKTLLPIAPVAGPPMIQIGTEGGYLVKAVSHPNNLFFNPITMKGNMLLGCAERSDFIIDFTGLAGNEYIMYNDAPGPFPAGPPTTDFFLGNPKNPVQPIAGTGPDTRQILRFKVVAAAAPDPQPTFTFPAGMPRDPFLVPYPATIPAVGPIAPLPLPAASATRNLTLNEDFDLYGRLRQLVGTTTPVPVVGKKNAIAFGLEYISPATETPAAGAVEIWNVYNLTADTHPMHFHLIELQILQRALFTMTKGLFAITPLTARGPELDELGYKETVKMNPGEVTTFCAKFNLPPVPFTVPMSNRTGNNEYVFHCHILEHEEHDMMRPLVVFGVNPQTPLAVNPASVTVNGQAGCCIPASAGTIFINSNTGAIVQANLVSSKPGVTATLNAAMNGNYSFIIAVAANTPGGAGTVTVTDPTSGQIASLAVDVFGLDVYSQNVVGAAGGIATFNILGGKKPYAAIVSSDPVNYPAVPIIDPVTLQTTGFTVNVAAGALPAIVTFTVSDAGVPPYTVTATLNIV